MSPRSIYFRNQADKCRSHAIALGDAETKAELRKLAEEYIVQAEEIERKENNAALRSREPSTQGILTFNDGENSA
jgi:hypothetical protein